MIADAMTIFGFGGFFTWSFVQRSIAERDVADAGISVFAWSVKLFLCLVALAILFFISLILRGFIILSITGIYSTNDWLWSSGAPVAYSISYAVSALVFIPLAVLTVSSVFLWSLAPFKKFKQRFIGKD